LAEAQKRTETRLGELAEAQKRTETRLGELAEAQKRTETRLEELAEAQKRTETRLEELAEAQKRTETRLEELAEAQKRTETRLEELAEAEKRTETRLEELAEAQTRTEKEIRKLTIGLRRVRQDVGGLSRSVAYGLENEAYRMAPTVLSKKYGINLSEKLIRAEIGGREVNLLGRGTRNGEQVLIVGEVKLYLGSRRPGRYAGVFEELDEKAEAVQQENEDMKLVKVLITHFASSVVLRDAEERGVIVIQSFDW